MAIFRKLNEKGEKIEDDNLKPVTTKKEIKDVVKDELSQWVEEIEEEDIKDWIVCPTCRIPYIFESGSGECVICGAGYLDGQWSFKKRKKGKVEREKKLKDLVESEEATQEESEGLEEINVGENGAPEFIEVKPIGISKCDGCGKKVNWNKIEPYYGQVPFVSGIAKKCPECDKEVYWLDIDNKQWVLKVEFDNREEEDSPFDI